MGEHRILHVVGARPNFMKAAPVIAALGRRRVAQTLVHTGQHYDARMSQLFFEELGLPRPDMDLSVGSGSHAFQTAEVMVRLEKVLQGAPPALVIVYGDINSTMAAAITSVKLGIPVAHVEAGLRSRDTGMPEEINRLVTDRLSELLFTPSEDGDSNLAAEGVERSRIFLVGNVMIDTLVRLLPAALESERKKSLTAGLARYALVTLHRPSNVDDPAALAALIAALGDVARDLPVIFPVHPRTLQRMEAIGGAKRSPGLRLLEPLGYLDFIALERDAAVVITDSGGIQEETTYLGVPCLTLRDNTERPVTLKGTNRLIGRDPAALRSAVEEVLDGDRPSGAVPPLWDGKAAERIAEVVCRRYAPASAD